MTTYLDIEQMGGARFTNQAVITSPDTAKLFGVELSYSELEAVQAIFARWLISAGRQLGFTTISDLFNADPDLRLHCVQEALNFYRQKQVDFICNQ